MLNVLIPYIDRYFSQFNSKLGLAEMVSVKGAEQTVTHPVIYISKGEGKQINLEGSTSYHRLRSSKTIEYTESNTIGCSKGIRLSYPMYFIGAIPNDCQYSNDTISNGLSNDLNKIRFEKQLRRSLKAWSIEIEVVEINTDSASVFEQEYTNVDLNIDLSQLYFSISYNIIIEADSSCLDDGCDNAPVVLCEGATILLNGESFLVVGSGMTKNILLVNQDDVTIIPVSVVDNKITVDTGIGSIEIENSDQSYTATATESPFELPDITVVTKNTLGTVVETHVSPSVIDTESVAPDGVADVKNSLGNSVSTVNVPSGVTIEPEAPDATIELVREGEVDAFKTFAAPSGATVQEEVLDSSAVLKDTAGVTISTTAVPAEDIVNITAPDGSAVLKDTAGVTLSTTAVKSNETKNITAPDSTVNLNGSPFLSPNSNETVDVTTVDQNGAAFPAQSVAGSQITLNRYDEVDLYMSNIGNSSPAIRAYLREHKQSLIAAGLWSKAYLINPLIGGTSGTNIFKLIGGDPMAFFGTVTHASTGVTGNGTNGYYKCRVSLEGISQNSNSIFIYSRTNNSQTGKVDIGAVDTGSVGTFIAANDGGNAVYRNYTSSGAGTTSIANSDSRGVFGISRNNSSNYFYQIRGTQGTITQGSGAVTNADRWDIYGLGVNGGGTAANFSTREQSYIWVGAGLTLSEMAVLRTIIDTLMTQLGRNV